MTTPEVLKPACVVLTPGIKATKHVVFGSQKLGPVPTAVLDALTTTRAKLLCECKDFAKPAQYQWEQEKAQFQLDGYMENASQYLSLLQGFLNAARAPAVTTPTDDNDEAAASKPVIAEKPAPTVSFAFCEWLDVTAKSSVHSLNAYHEYAHALYAVGTVLLQRASDLTKAMLSSRDFEFDEPKLKEAYQILLRTSGLFDAALGFLGQNRQTTAATGADDAALAAWRAEQAQADTAATFAPELSRIKDFEGGAGLTALRAIALAQAQELVVLRGVTRETVDWVLMGKLCVDIASRYKDTLASLPSSQLKLRGWCDFKTIYYTALGFYYQGVAEWNKKDAPGCVQAIAQFQQAKEHLARLTTFTAETQRTRDIIQRDLDIAAARNSSVYFETIPPPLPALPPTGLVQPQAFVNPPAHALWKEPLPPAQEATSAAAPTRGSPDMPHPDPGCACAIM